MMRSPNSLAVVCRSPAGSLVVKEQPWRSIWERLRFLRWPFLRGTVVLGESLVNGFSALTFSAQLQMKAEAEKDAAEGKGPKDGPPEAPPSMAGMIFVSVLFAIGLFVAAPHLLTALLGFRSDTLSFHLVDGVIKVAIFVAYLAGISLMDDIKRVFMYHGAEHQAIFAYEQGDLSLEGARRQSRFHPRCGTSFLVIVILISILLFAVTLRFPIFETRILDNLIKVLIKIPLMLPVAGLAYEAIKLSGKYPRHPLVRVLSAPGLWIQRITTRKPTDDQLEVAVIAIEKTLWREQQRAKDGADATPPTGAVEEFETFEAARPVLS